MSGSPAAASAARATTAAATTTTTAATATLGARASFVDGQIATIEVLAVERGHRRPGLIIVVHLDKPEAARAARVTIHHESDRSHFAVSREGIPECGFGRIERQIPDIELHNDSTCARGRVNRGLDSGERKLRRPR